jgi:hypothetical protein
MSLLKLWNTITGRSSAKPQVDSPANETSNSTAGPTAAKSPQVSAKPAGNAIGPVSQATKSAVQSRDAMTANLKTRESTSTTATSATQTPSTKATKSESKKRKAPTPTIKIAFEPEVAPVAAAKPVRPKVNRRDPLVTALLASPVLAEALKNSSSVSTLTVLEIGVGDGARAIKICDTLREAAPSVRYIAIDQFEMGGGNLKLMDFHRLMRTAEVRPQVFPETVAAGLVRVSHTVGACDLILIDESVDDQQIAGLANPLARIAHESTQVLVCKGGKWRVHPLARADLRRAA